MPITQDRMRRVIEAGANLLENYKTLISATKQFSTDSVVDEINGLHRFGVNPNNPNLARILAMHEALIDAIQSCAPKFDDAQSIAQELGHFNAKRRDNDRARTSMQNLRRRRAEREFDEEFEATNGISTVKQEPLELTLDLGEIHTQVLEIWNRTKDANPTMNIHTIVDVIAQLGEPDQRKQARLVGNMVEEGLLLTTEIGGEYIVEEL
jgi:hypothetical protein